ncbi:MAG: hypothetical protein HGA82_03035 [Anaerolineales bacterium]|nr:hypothetical protein [Anaerolineales bacterium]
MPDLLRNVVRRVAMRVLQVPVRIAGQCSVGTPRSRNYADFVAMLSRQVRRFRCCRHDDDTGSRDFVLPGNKPEVVAHYTNYLSGRVENRMPSRRPSWTHCDAAVSRRRSRAGGNPRKFPPKKAIWADPLRGPRNLRNSPADANPSPGSGRVFAWPAKAHWLQKTQRWGQAAWGRKTGTMKGRRLMSPSQAIAAFELGMLMGDL